MYIVFVRPRIAPRSYVLTAYDKKTSLTQSIVEIANACVEADITRLIWLMMREDPASDVIVYYVVHCTMSRSLVK